MADQEVLSVPPLSTDNHLKRKLDDIEESPPPTHVLPRDSTDVEDDDGTVNGGDQEHAKRHRVDDEQQLSDSLEHSASENGHKQEEDNGTLKTESVETAVDDQVGTEEVKEEVIPNELNDAQPFVESDQKVEGQDHESEGKEADVPSLETAVSESVETTAVEGGEQGDGSEKQNSESGGRGLSRKIEIPNNKVGVLIGKSGDTIKYLQLNSGAKIQITRDADADPRAATRPVELVGPLECLNKAERLIKDVIAEADAGGSPSLVARGFSAALSAGSVEIEIPVIGDKVGLIIGKGGETIRNLQTRSGARIQLIPQNVPGEPPAKEKKVKVTGDKRQVEVARELILEVMNQQPGRPSQFSSGGYNQQGYRPRGPTGGPQWGSRGPHPSQPMPYDYHRGPYPSQNQQYPPQPYNNYPPQGPPRGGYGSWDHRPPSQGPPSHGGGYDYYGQGGGHAGNAPPSNPHSGHMPSHHHASGPSMGPPPHSQPNYNYPQPRTQDYGHPPPYSQNAPPPQNYGHGYGDTQAPMQQHQHQQPYPGQGYAPPQQGYAPQQQYNRPPSYPMPSQGPPAQGYAAPPAPTQPSADPSYQAPVAASQPYPQNMQHQQYPQQAPYGSNDGYIQPQQPAAAGYPQQAAQPQHQPQPVPAYGQPGYATQTPGSTAGYGQYPTTAQPTYADPSTAAAATGAANYGYPGQVDPSAYGTAPGQAYGAGPTQAPQGGYAQPAPTQPGYDQTQAVAQSGAYATAPAGAPVPYGKTLSPQPQPAAYPQYDASQQVYAAPR